MDGWDLDDQVSPFCQVEQNTELYCTYAAVPPPRVRWSKKRKLHSRQHNRREMDDEEKKSKVSSYSHGVGKVADMLKVIFSPLFSDNKDSYSILRRMGIHGDRLGEKAVSSSHRWLSVSVSHEMRGRPTVDLTEIIRCRRHWKVVGLSRSCETRKKHI